MRADTKKTRERLLDAGTRLLDQSPTASLAEIAAAAGVARSTLNRHFPRRKDLVEAIGRPPDASAVTAPRATGHDRDQTLPAGQLGRERPVSLEAIHVFDVVAPPMLPEQLVAEAQRIAGVPVALYVLDIDGSHLLRVAGPERLPERIEAPLAIGPELDADGLGALRDSLSGHRGVEVVPLWLRGRATGAILTLGRPRRPLAEIARQAAAAIALADRYTDAFARGQRRKQPKAAAEIQQSLLPPRISRITGGEVAGNVLPTYEVAGDWFDIVENLDGVWITVADGLGETTRAAASSAVALGALRASRRNGGTTMDALMLMHRTLKEMPGPRAEMSAVTAQWDPATFRLDLVTCGHMAPIVIRANREPEIIEMPPGRGLGGRSTPKPSEQTTTLEPGDRLLMFSDGVARDGEGQAGLGVQGVIEAALMSERASAADTVRRIHQKVLESCDSKLRDDATVVCLAAE